MKVLDLDLDYFMNNVPEASPDISVRLDGGLNDDYVWDANKVRDFSEKNLGLSKYNKIKGKLVKEHKEALFLEGFNC